MALLGATPGRWAERAATSGNSLVTADSAGAAGRYTSLALDASGTPVVSYFEPGGNNLRVLRCGNSICSAGNAIALPDSSGASGPYTSIALDTQGRPVVAYAALSGGLYRLRVLRCGDASCSAGNTIAFPDEVSRIAFDGIALTLDAAANPVVAYYDDTHDDLKVLHCGNPTCLAGNTITSPEVLGFAGAYPSIRLDAGGNPVVSYEATGDLHVLHCGDATCSTGNTIAAPDTADIVGEHTSLALDAAGNPIVSYRDVTNQDLKVLRCGNPLCTSGNIIRSPDTAGEVGEYSSLALDSTGRPIVSYLDRTNGDLNLKVLRCANPFCTLTPTIVSPDTAGDVGEYTSVALDSLGNPVVSYFDATNGALKVLHCTQPTCADVKPPPPTATPTLALPGLTPAAVGGIAELPAAAREAPTSSPRGEGRASLVIAAAVGVCVLGAACLARRGRGVS